MDWLTTENVLAIGFTILSIVFACVSLWAIEMHYKQMLYIMMFSIVEPLYIEATNELHKQQREKQALYDAILAHHSARGHNRCWLNDLELYKAAGLPPDPTLFKLPCLEEFLSKCQEYHQQQTQEESK